MTIPQGYCQVTHLFRGASVPLGAAVTYGLLNIVGQTPSQIAEIQHDNWADNFGTVQTIPTVLEETLVKFGPDATGASGSYSAARPGIRVGNSLAPHTALLVRKRTAQGGRAARGRFYVPGISEDDVDGGGFLTAGYLGLCQGAANAFLIRCDAETGGMVIHHNPDKNNYTPAPFDVTSLSPDDRVATQRRRLRR